MRKQTKKHLIVFLRYLILLIVAIPNLYLFYLIFTPLTLHPVRFLLEIFYDTILVNNIIIINSILPIELIPACIAGAAYYLLLILNLSTPKIKLKPRLKMILISFASLLVLNILRIFILSILAFSGSPLFDITHKIFWYALSTVFVVGIWLILVKKFKIKEIPLYSDLKFLYNNSIKKLRI